MIRAKSSNLITNIKSHVQTAKLAEKEKIDETGQMHYFLDNPDVSIISSSEANASNLPYVEAYGDPDVKIVSNPGRINSSDVLIIGEPNSRPQFSSRFYKSSNVEPEPYYDPAIFEDPNLNVDYDDFWSMFGLKKGGLIPRKLIGGLIPKFQNPYEALKRTIYKKGNNYYAKDINGRDFQLTTPTANKILKERRDLQYKIMTSPNTSLAQKAAAASLYYRDKGNIELANKNAKNMNRLSRILSTTKPANQNPGTQGSAKGGRKGGKTTLPPMGTASPDLSTMSAEQLQARNNVMTRGYRDYFFNGLRYSFTGEDLTNAENNWKINRGRLNSEAKGLLGLPGQLTGKIVEAKPLTETFSDPNTPKEITIPADFTPEMLTQAIRKKWIADSRLRAIPAEKIQETDYGKPFAMHFGADRNWNGMTDEQKLNYLQTMDKAIDPNDNTLSLYDVNGNLILNQSENSSFGPLTLSELYNADKGAFNDYMNNFRGKAWDTATDEGSKTYKGMLDYYNLNRKAVDKYAKKQKWQANSPEVFNYLYTQYSNTLPKARKGTKLIPRNKWQR